MYNCPFNLITEHKDELEGKNISVADNCTFDKTTYRRKMLLISAPHPRAEKGRKAVSTCKLY